MRLQSDEGVDVGEYGAKGFQAVVALYPPMLIPKRDEPGAYTAPFPNG